MSVLAELSAPARERHTARPARSRHVIAAALASLMAFALAACSSDPATPETPAAPADRGTVINVSGVDMAFIAPELPTAPGTYTFVFTNDGGMQHDLVIEGIDGAETPVIAPGDTAEFTVTLEAGEYTMYCSVSNHRSLGMELSFTVS